MLLAIILIALAFFGYAAEHLCQYIDAHTNNSISRWLDAYKSN